jgi:hypothetical protein
MDFDELNPQVAGSDAALSQLCKQWMDLKKRRMYEESDLFRTELLSLGVVVSDWETFPDGNHWMRLEVTEYASKSKGCLCWRHTRQNYCGLERLIGEWFCANHVANGFKGRIPCPLDPKHSLKPAKIASHVLVCQSRPGQAFIQPVGSTTDSSTGPAELSSEYVSATPTHTRLNKLLRLLLFSAGRSITESRALVATRSSCWYCRQSYWTCCEQ